MSNWGTLVKSQCPHKYGPLNVATAVDSGLGGGIILLFCGWLCAGSRDTDTDCCAWLCGWSRDTDTGCCHSQHFYRLIASVRWVVTTFQHQQIIALWSWALAARGYKLQHLSIIWWYSNDPSTMPLLTLPFYISNDFLFSAALLAGEQLAWRRGPRLDNDEIKFQKWNSNEIFLASSLIPNMGAAALSLCHCGTQPCCGTCIQINQNMTAKYEIQLWIKGLSFLQITQTKIFTIFIATRHAK